MFREALSRRDPVLFVVTMMDKEHADFDAIYQQIKSRLTSKVIPIEVPVGQGADFHGIVNLFDKTYLLRDGSGVGVGAVPPVPQPVTQPSGAAWRASGPSAAVSGT